MKDIVDRIKEIGKCHVCRGTYNINGVCEFCRNNNEELSRLLNEVKKAIKNNINNMQINEIDNQLFRLKSYEEVNKYLLSKNYYKKIKKIEDELFNKILNYSVPNLNIDDIKQIQFFSENSLNREHKKIFGQYLILCNYIKPGMITKNEFIFSLKSFTLAMLSELSFNPKFVIKDMELGTCGGCNFYKTKNSNTCEVTFNEDHLDELYKGKSILPIITIFHEYVHLVQYSLLQEANVINEDLLLQIEDYILSDYFPVEEYYHANYKYISFENAAEESAISMLAELLNKYNISLKNNDFLDIEENISALKMNKHMKRYRMYNGKFYALDDLFDKFVNETNDMNSVLDMYPQLFCIYFYKDGKYCRRDEETIKEFINAYSNANNSLINNYVDKVSEYHEGTF